MRAGPRYAVLTVAAAAMLAAPIAPAQPNLPPPPPPPMGQPTDLPPPPPAPPHAYDAPPPPPPYRAPRRRREVVVFFYDDPRPVAITLNPLDLGLSRLSANVEVLVAPHHSLIVSPNILVLDENRGGRYSLFTEALGFASQTSSGFGVEVGYHYWWRWRRSLRGPFFGPSALLGSTTNAYVGTTNNAQGYWGVAFDLGGQEVLPGGFTLGAGLGLGLVHMADATAVFPRVLMQIGWSF
jgi:hypothetical protein